jgi:hypothetical protein
MAGNTYVQFFKYTYSGSAVGFNFANIPQTCQDLAIRISWREQGSGTLGSYYSYFNGDQSTVYRQTTMYGNQSSVFAYNLSSQNGIVPVIGASGGGSTANGFGNVEMYIPNYTSTQQSKSVSIEGTSTNNSASTDANRTMVGSVSYSPSTNAPITSIWIQGNAANPANYTEVTIYGVKNY